MLNRGLLAKTLRETWFLTLLLGVGLFVFEGVVAYVIPRFEAEITEQFLRLPFFRNLIGALVGSSFGNQLNPLTFRSLPWVHPVALSLVWAHAIIFATRVPAGEIDRGTIDLLLGFPVSRWQLFVSESAFGLASGALVLALGLGGYVLGTTALPPEQRADWGRIGVVLVNFLALYAAVGALAYLVSASSERRGKAMGLVFGLVLGSFFLNFLSQLWEPARTLSFLGLLDYYRPLEIISGQGWPWGNLSVLGVFATTAWVAAGVVFVRRDVATV